MPFAFGCRATALPASFLVIGTSNAFVSLPSGTGGALFSACSFNWRPRLAALFTQFDVTFLFGAIACFFFAFSLRVYCLLIIRKPHCPCCPVVGLITFSCLPTCFILCILYFFAYFNYSSTCRRSSSRTAAKGGFVVAWIGAEMTRFNLNMPVKEEVANAVGECALFLIICLFTHISPTGAKLLNWLLQLLIA